jgi:hypothetical protein
MGQYYRLVNVDKKESVECAGALAELGGIKLTSSCFVGNGFTNLAASLLSDRWRGDRVMYVGDYAWDEVDGDWARSGERMGALRGLKEAGAISSDPYSDNSYEDVSPLVVAGEIGIRQARYVCDLDLGAYYDRDAMPIAWEADGEAVRYDPLLLLIAQGNGLGGGDYEAEDGSMDRVGWWACHEIAQFDEVPDGLEDVGCPFWGGLSEAE